MIVCLVIYTWLSWKDWGGVQVRVEPTLCIIIHLLTHGYDPRSRILQKSSSVWTNNWLSTLIINSYLHPPSPNIRKLQLWKSTNIQVQFSSPQNRKFNAELKPHSSCHAQDSASPILRPSCPHISHLDAKSGSAKTNGLRTIEHGRRIRHAEQLEGRRW